MANQPFQRAPGKGKFAYLGVDLKNPNDLMPEGRAPFLLNVSPDAEQGSLRARAGMTNITTLPYPAHSAMRLNDALPGAAVPAWNYLIGASTYLYVGKTGSFAVADSGYSGNPLSLVTYRPPQSPEAWLYAFDSNKQAKYRTDGSKANIGILPPTQPPTTQVLGQLYTPILDVGGSTAAAWSGSNGASNPTVSQRVPSGTTVANILYDTGTTGWASVQPTNSSGSYSWLGVGARLTVDTEVGTVYQVFSSLGSTTISAIAYDSGTSGMATVVPATAIQGLARNAMVLIGSTPARVLSVTEGPDGLYSFRAVLASGVSAGATLTIPASYRAFFNNTHSTGASLGQNNLSSTVTPSSPGNLTTALISTTSSIGILNLTQSYGRQLTDNDYLHFSIRVGTPINVQEVHILLDVDSTTNDFNHNYYFFVLRQNDFLNSALGDATSTSDLLNALSTQIAQSFSEPQPGTSDYPSVSILGDDAPPASDQLASGASQWVEVIIKISDLTRVGNDPSVGLNNVKALGVMVLATGTTTVDFGSWFATGGYGPDANFNTNGNQGQPILYRYRYRSSATGAVSDVSPATRNGELPFRQAVLVTTIGSTDPQVDLVDIERNGGTFDTWHRVMTVGNNPFGNTQYDIVEEETAKAGDPLELLQYAPWPVTDRPHYGNCNIVGTRVTWVSGDTFNLNWIRGVEFIVNNMTYTLYAPPDSTTTLQTAENIGVFTNVPFIIPEATIVGVPLPYVCGPFDGRLWATGDAYNPGLLYFSNPYNPDSASDQGYIEVTSPSEPLGPPVYYEGTIFVFTANSVYRVESTPGQVNPYAAYKLGSVTGLAANWAISSKGPMLAWLGPDGIYGFMAAGSAANLTRNDLYPLFPFESRPGLPVVVNPPAATPYTLYPPDYTQPSTFRLSYAHGFLFFDYKDISGAYNTFTYNLETKGWIPYSYNPNVRLHYQEEGVSNPLTLAFGSDGSINQISNSTNDIGGPITAVVVTPADNQGETRARKQYGDVALDYQGGPSLTTYYDSYLLLGTMPTIPQTAQRGTQVYDLGLDSISAHRSIGMLITFSGSSGTILYEWQPSFLIEPEDTLNRATDWMDAGNPHYKFVHGCRITADTAGVTRTIQIQYDGGLLGPVLSVTHAVEMTLPYSFPPFKAHLIRLVPADSASWRLMNVQWEVDPEPEPTGYWVTQPTSFELPGYLHIRDLQLAYATPNAGAVLTLIVDGTSYLLAPALPATGGSEVKTYIVAPPIKGKIWQLYATGSALQIYQKDCEFRIKPWGAPSYAMLKPFGDTTFDSGGARI